MTKDLNLEAVNGALGREVRKLQEELKAADKVNADLIISLRAENERLRQVLENTQQARVLQGKAITDASNEIQRLRAALEDVAYGNPLHNEDDLMRIARAALEEKQ